MIAYGHAPSGHAAAALAIEAAAASAGADCRRIEVAGEHHPVLGKLIAASYHAAARRCPSFLAAAAASGAGRGIIRAARSLYFSRANARRLGDSVRRFDPDVIICPQLSIAAIMSEARRRRVFDVPVMSVLTDYGAPPFWTRPAPDLIAASCENARAHLLLSDAPGRAVVTTGIPVHPAFSARPTRKAARKMLSLPSAAPIVLVSGGSQGLGDLRAIVPLLLRSNPRLHALVLCGRNDALRRILSADQNTGGRLRVFGAQPPDMVAALLAAANIFVGKAGGVSCAESLACGVPLVIVGAFPGQEQANARYLASCGAAVVAKTPLLGAQIVAELFAEPKKLTEMSLRAACAGRPDSARRIASAALKIAESLIDSQSVEV